MNASPYSPLVQVPSAATLPNPAATQQSRRRTLFYVGMALVAFALVTAGFAPSLINTEHRNAPLNLAVGLHIIVFTAWLVLFLAQSVLVHVNRVPVHRRLGYLGAALALLMVVTGYFTAVSLARRGFDLSGDLRIEKDPLGLLVFQLGDLLSFAVLVGAGVLLRRRVDIHKRLMLLATVGSLMAAPLTHLISNIPALRNLPGAIILVPLILLYTSHAVYDRLSLGRIHPVSLWVAVSLFVWANLRAAIIGPSPAWRKFAAWLVN